MPTLTHIRKTVRKARKNGIPYRQIAQPLGISAAAVARIESGAYPNERTANALGIPPLCVTCHRKLPAPRQPRQPAPKIGRDPGWIEYWMKK